MEKTEVVVRSDRGGRGLKPIGWFQRMVSFLSSAPIGADVD